MKIHFTFICLCFVGFMSTAQNINFETFDKAIAIKPNLTLVDLSNKSFSIIDSTLKFSNLKYNLDLKNQPKTFKMEIPNVQIVREGFMVFNPKLLKRRFFQDFTISHRRSQLERFLPRLPNISDFTPCF